MAKKPTQKIEAVATVKTVPPLSEPGRLLSRTEVLEIVGVTYPTLWAWVKKGHFPSPRRLGFTKQPQGRVGWIEAEVQAWIRALPKKYPKGTKLTEVA